MSGRFDLRHFFSIQHLRSKIAYIRVLIATEKDDKIVETDICLKRMTDR